MHVHALWDASVPAPFFDLFLKSGVTSVRILRGDHCLGLIADLTPANSNLAA